MNAWMFLGLAVALEIAGTFLLKLSHGFEKWHWGVLSIASYAACFTVLAPAMRALPLGVVYAIWSGVGIVAAALIGVYAFDERLGAIQFFFIALILIGTVGLQLSTSA